MTAPALLLLAVPLLAAPQETTAPPAPGPAEADQRATDQGFAGEWEGTIEVANLDVQVTLEEGDSGWSGAISIPAQGASDLPLGSFERDGDVLRFRIEGVPGEPTFEGTLSEDGNTLAGPFTQGGAKLSFTLTRVGTGEPVLSPEQLEELKAWIDGTRAAWDVPGLGVAIVSRDEVLFAGGFGVLEVGEDAAVDGDTLFAIGSSTKAFTTLSLMIAREKGADLDLDDPVSKHLPRFRLADPDVTRGLIVRDLVTHRTGLPRHDLMWYGRSARTEDEIVAGMAHLELSAGLREQFQYNNLGFLVASHVLRAATGRHWRDFVREEIFGPLGMERSVLTEAGMLAAKNRAMGHRMKEGAKPRAAEAIPVRDLDMIAPAGSIVSSARDMARWAQFQLGDGGSLVGAGALRELHTPQVAIPELPNDAMLGITSVAHGWFVDGYRGHLRLHHGGNIDGYSAMVAFFPKDDLGVVALASMNGSAVPEYVVRRVADVAFGLEPRGWSEGDLDARDAGGDEGEEGDAEGDESDPVRIPGTSPSHGTEAYAGTYEHPGYGRIVIAEGAATPLTFHLGTLRSELAHWHHDVFRLEESPEFEGSPLDGALLRFETDLAGEIVALLIVLDPAVPEVRFELAAAAELSDPDVLATYAGAFELRGLTLTIALRGEELVVSVPGQPDQVMQPVRRDVFKIEDAEGYSLAFRRDDAGEIHELEVRQPNGTFIAKKKE